MTSRIVAMLWERWRHTWMLALAAAALLGAFTAAWWQFPFKGHGELAGLHMFVQVIFILLYIADESRSDPAVGAFPKRLFALPVRMGEVLFTALAVPTVVLVLLYAAGHAVVSTLDTKSVWPGLGFGFAFPAMWFAVIYALTLPVRTMPALRVALAVLLVFPGLGLFKMVCDPPAKALALLPVVYAAAYWLSLMQLRAERRGAPVATWLTGLVDLRQAGYSDTMCWRLLGAPGREPLGAGLWYELRGGSIPIMALFAAVVGYLAWLFPTLTFVAMDKVDHTWPQHAREALMAAAIVGSLAIAFLAIAALGTRLVGQTATGMPFEVSLRLLYRHPVSTGDLAWRKIAGLAGGVATWGIALAVAVTLIMYTGAWLFNDPDNVTLEQLLRLYASTLYAAWTVAGIILAVVLTGRQWVGHVFILALFGLFLASIPLSLVDSGHFNFSPETVEAIFRAACWTGLALGIGTCVGALRTALVRGLLSPARLALCAAVCALLFGYHIMELARVSRGGGLDGALRAAFFTLAWLLPLAPVGLIPLACDWGRRR